MRLQIPGVQTIHRACTAGGHADSHVVARGTLLLIAHPPAKVSIAYLSVSCASWQGCCAGR